MMKDKQNPNALKKLLVDRRLRAEMSHLFRCAPFKNGDKRDEGWMCRDHSFVIACIAALRGFVPHICWGKMFLTGHDFHTGGIRQIQISEHSWNDVDNFGFVDMSINLDNSEENGWQGWSSKCMLQSKLYPCVDESFRYFVSGQYSDFCAASDASIANRKKTIAYYGEKIAILATDYAEGSVGYINSPLTDELKELSEFNDEIYMRAAWHVWLVSNRRARPLTSIPKPEAWAFIASNYQEGVKSIMKCISKLPKA